MGLSRKDSWMAGTASREEASAQQLIIRRFRQSSCAAIGPVRRRILRSNSALAGAARRYFFKGPSSDDEIGFGGRRSPSRRSQQRRSPCNRNWSSRTFRKVGLQTETKASDGDCNKNRRVA